MSKQLFIDLGFSEDKAQEHALRTEIAEQISILIENGKLKQTDAAKLFNVPQPTISKICNGDISKLSLSYFVRMLFHANLLFTIRKNELGEMHVEIAARQSQLAPVRLGLESRESVAEISGDVTKGYARPAMKVEALPDELHGSVYQSISSQTVQ